MPAPFPIDRLVRSRRKTISLIIQSDGTLTVRAPLRMSDKHIQEFVHLHMDWILKKQALVRSAPPAFKKEFQAGETFLFHGKEYPLVVGPGQKSTLIFQGDRFVITRAGLPKARQAFLRWYREQARQFLTERVSVLARQHGFVYTKIRITSARTRWGSCSSRGTLSFTWRLIMAPPEVIDYVVIHELVHTRVNNHSRLFWQTVALIMPDYKLQVTWLKKNGRNLTMGDA